MRTPIELKLGTHKVSKTLIQKGEEIITPTHICKNDWRDSIQIGMYRVTYLASTSTAKFVIIR